jgi:nucleoside-diphosphate-sugar epimerase
VTVGARTDAPSDHELVTVDREEEGALAVANGFDLLVDVIPFEARHAEQLLGCDVGAIVAVSSASVYADAQGRTLDEAESADDFPEFPVPIPETQPTVPPGDATYSTKKVALEQVLLENGDVPATIVRPCAIYGRGDRMAREWHFVKRALDRRPYLVLTNHGIGHFHTTASENIGELVRLAAAAPRTGAYNCGDPDPPQLLEIARTICDRVGHAPTEILLTEFGDVGATPWSVPKPLLVDMAKAERELGYTPATTWAAALPKQVDWLIEATRGREWQDVLTRGAQYLKFDYEAEDELVRSLAA